MTVLILIRCEYWFHLGANARTECSGRSNGHVLFLVSWHPISLNALLSWRARRMPARVWAVGRSSYDCAGLISKSDEPDWLQEQRWRKILFITQGFDGIQPGCPIGRIETEKQSHRQ